MFNFGFRDFGFLNGLLSNFTIPTLGVMRYLCASAALGMALLSSCSFPNGKPRENSQPLAPDEVMEFGTLYAENCAGCHGSEGRRGAAIALADPVYLGIADEAVMRKVIANGVRGTSMPPFAQSAGGTLTNKQIGVITTQIRSRWAQAGADPPSYMPTSTGDARRGGIVYKTYCESCHGPEGQGGAKGSSITNDSFLALVSDQYLRTIVIVGRPELGAPDWRGNVPGKPMSEQEITDVVTWLGSHRVRNPGQPYFVSNSQKRQESDHVERNQP
jgi:mono/diheme cytochrome c family protein